MPTLSRFILALSPMLLAIGSVLIAFPAGADDQPEPIACATPDGWAEVVARNPDFVVFGEHHGTVEAPALISRIVCAEALSGQHLLLAFEHSSWRNTAWQDAWALPHQDFQEVLPDLGWRGREDGVASEAMFALIAGAHALRANGAKIDIVAFNGARDDTQRARFADLPSQGPHEAAQAENIADAAAREDYDRVIVLVGGLHAMVRATSIGGERFDPMAVRLRSYGSVLSLEMQHGGGEAWNCQRACNANPARADMQSDRQPYIGFDEFPDERVREAFDGIYWLGPITASPPAFPAEE